MDIKVGEILLEDSISKINSIESYRQCNSNLINVNALRILIGIEGNTIASKQVRSKPIRWHGCTRLNELDALNGTLQGTVGVPLNRLNRPVHTSKNKGGFFDGFI
mgnify:FL=1